MQHIATKKGAFMGLKKNISLLGVFSLATGAMISTGIFILPTLIYQTAGATVPLVYFFSGLLSFIGIQSIIELSTAMPKAGGDYYFINKSLGPIEGTISGIFSWIALSLKSAFAIYGFALLLNSFFNIPYAYSGLIAVALLVLINCIGIKEATWLQVILVIALFLLLGVFIIWGSFEIEQVNFETIKTVNKHDFLLAIGFVSISFWGVLKVSTIAEEVENPKKNIPEGMMITIVVITIVYTLTAIVITGVLNSGEFSSSTAPISDTALKIFGKLGYYVFTIAASLAFLTTANAGILAASRYPYSLSRDELVPSLFLKTNKNAQPYIAIIATGILVYLSFLLPIKTLVKVASSVIFTSYILTNLAVIILKESKLANYKPTYKAPFYPYLQIFCIGIFIFFISILGSSTFELSVSLIIFGILVYIFYGKKHYAGEYAILHLVKRITDKKLKEGKFENELREIVLHRDSIEKNEFKTLIMNSPIIDLKKKCTFNELLALCSRELSEHSDLSITEVMQRFKSREEQLTTVLSPTLAVPHIITEPNSTMFVILVRCKEGIHFSPLYEDVKAVFLIGGPFNQREKHLKTLSSIVSKVSEDNFEEKWLCCEHKEDLKNIFIL